MSSGCHIIVVAPSSTERGGLVFGKNSDRPRGEVQEIVYSVERRYDEGDKLQCTHVEIGQSAKTRAVILSKPAWMWGAEMGANDAGVVIANTPVSTKIAPTDDRKRLLGMDLVRLGLERGGSAAEAVDVITSLLEAHGQGGPCPDSENTNRDNGFLIADSGEAWIVETAGRLWAAQRITDGFRIISNSLSITTKIDRMAENLKAYAIENNLWDGQGDFNFKEAFGGGDDDAGGVARDTVSVARLVEEMTAGAKFTVKNMFEILRNKEMDICRDAENAFPTAGAQVSILYKDKPNTHWFTGTPDTSLSVFKPFIFTPNARISQFTVSPDAGDNADEARRVHNLYKLHDSAVTRRSWATLDELRRMESSCVDEVDAFVDRPATGGDGRSLAEVDDLFRDVVETEIKFYK